MVAHLDHSSKEGCSFKKEDIFGSQDELKSFWKNVANHFLYVNLVVFKKGKAQGRVISNSIELPFETYMQIYQKGKNATKMNTVLKKADVLRPKQTDTVNEIENRL